ncbi:MAG TPA: tRNA-dihydrouridine synthase [Pirellulales bacterium]|jgi:nifR3 family TIM-barrel protein|nr:tRNA-dihydrouridine synthase [Pirellulales bacterium]
MTHSLLNPPLSASPPSGAPLAPPALPTELKELRLGDLRLEFPVVQAALSGYSDWAMRVIARRLGAPYTLCEVMLDKFLIEMSHTKKNRKRMRVTDEEHPVGGQLMGAVPEDFGPAALRLVEAGFDVIDINFGCPVKKVLGRCRGGFHLSQPAVALEIVARVRAAVPPRIPVTVKMRRGLDDSAASRDNFFTIFEGAFERGAVAITVHGRTVEQRYIGPSRWAFLRELKALYPDRMILGSGDLFTAADCLAMLHETGVDGVTAARGAIGNPWIFSQARVLAAGGPLPDPPSLFEQRRIIAEHYRLAEQIYGAEVCGRQMRKFGIKYSKLHPQATLVRDAFVAVRRPQELPAVLERFYAKDLPGVHPNDMDEIRECD